MTDKRKNEIINCIMQVFDTLNHVYNMIDNFGLEGAEDRIKELYSNNTEKKDKYLRTYHAIIAEDRYKNAGHKKLDTLYCRGCYLANKYFNKIINFDKLVNNYQNKKEQEYNVKGYFNLPKKIRIEAEKYLGNELRKIWNEACEDKQKNNSSTDYELVYSAIQYICFNDYNFLNNKNKVKGQKE